VLAFCLDTKKREGGRAWPHRQSAESRIVSKQNASPVLFTLLLLQKTASEEREWTPCVKDVSGFASCFLFSVETQHTIG
jgi:hypothetical protein